MSGGGHYWTHYPSPKCPNMWNLNAELASWSWVNRTVAGPEKIVLMATLGEKGMSVER